MVTIRSFLASIALTAFAVPALANDIHAGDIVISHPWARASAGKAGNSAAYFAITDTGKSADRLVDAATPAAESAMLHLSIMENGVAKMKMLSGIDIKPGEVVELKPGALHVMLVGLKAPLKEGDRFPMTLTFQKAGEVKLDVEIHGPGASHAGHAGH
ncbi:MAG: copper chaperone PCu(A)C [Alphaproteobacteria bacterium]|nr:copper chaperone PCu(A)C [Alphaproteobacteria bacterium]